MTKQHDAITDLSYLHEAAGNSVAFIIEMIDLFLTSTPVQLTLIAQALDNNDKQNTKRYVHKLKPTLAMVGMNDAVAIAEKMEKECLTIQSLVQLKPFLDTLETTCSRAYVELETYKHQLT